MRSALPLAVAALLPLVALATSRGSSPDGFATPPAPPAAAHVVDPGTPGGGTCVECHAGIEDIHPGYRLTCVYCHGGDDTAKTLERAHVMPARSVPGDERVLPQNYDLAWQRFKNPSNLRVAKAVCGTCHGEYVDNVLKSLHGTTAGHLGDGYYEHGLVDHKKPVYSIFPVRDDDGDVPPHAITATKQVPPFNRNGAKDRIETHYSDLPRKACMHCHLWSEGRGVDGRLGMDGDYRGEGCAACHVTYADDGRSRSRDRSIDKLEPGHPLEHRFTSAIPTDTCTRCHYGDASIGLHFRGLAQLVPGMPAGPEVEGTTDALLNGQFYIQDPDMTPPDVHHAAGMHCIDCHTSADTMGDGNIYAQMDHAVEIECTSCHGTLDAVADLTTSHGRRVTNLDRDGDDFWLTSKVTGERHRVKQVKHVIDPNHADYNARAAEAMTPEHGKLECYTCHNGWNVNFFGFHFDRNEQFTQLDLLSGERTPGRVTTQEKVFASFNQFRLGYNHEGMIAPYLVGFSTIGSARDANGEFVLHQETPETAAKLSGVTLVPHQMHTTRTTARDCVECHRSPATWGLGSANFRLTREFGYAITRDALFSVAIDGGTPARTGPAASLAIPGKDLRALAIRSDPVHADATHAYVAHDDGALTVVKLANPVAPRKVTTKKGVLRDPRRLVAQGDWLFAADGPGGIAIFDIARPEQPKVVGHYPALDARAVSLAWPWLLVANGADGLEIVDVTDPARPSHVSTVDLNGGESTANDAVDVTVLFQYSKTRVDRNRRDRIERSRARHLAFVACGLDGVRVVDFTQADRPVVLHGKTARRAFRFSRGDVRGIAVNTVFDIGSAGGGLDSGEHDYLYVHVNEGNDANRIQRVVVFDVSDPLRPRRLREAPRTYGGTGRLLMFRAYNEPFLQHFVVAVGAGGLGTLVDVSKAPTTGAQITTVWEDLNGIRDMALEEFAFDRLIDERGRPLKDISHDGCRYLTKDEIRRVLGVDVPVGQYQTDSYGFARER